MPNELTIQFTSEDVELINSIGQQVAIVKETDRGGDTDRVVWVAFSPFENNLVEWEEEYGVYASNTEIQDGATIQKLSDVNPAEEGLSYPFQNGTFAPPFPGEPGAYQIINHEGVQLTFGLVQSVMVGGNPLDANVLNAVPVLVDQTATFIPIERVEVFLHGVIDNGTVISEITSEALLVDFTNDRAQIIHYDGSSGTFIPGPLN